MYDVLSLFFFFNDTATTEIYTLSLHDALPILILPPSGRGQTAACTGYQAPTRPLAPPSAEILVRNGARADRKSTRLNSSHSQISYAVFCLKKKIKPHPWHSWS